MTTFTIAGQGQVTFGKNVLRSPSLKPEQRIEQ